MRDLPGTPKKLILGGSDMFHYMADADPQFGRAKYTATALPHTGGNMHQMIVQSTESTGHRIKCNGAELSRLKAWAEKEDNYTISWVNRAGDTYSCTGWIGFDYASAANGSVELTLYPETDWTEFLG